MVVYLSKDYPNYDYQEKALDQTMITFKKKRSFERFSCKRIFCSYLRGDPWWPARRRRPRPPISEELDPNRGWSTDWRRPRGWRARRGAGVQVHVKHPVHRNPTALNHRARSAAVEKHWHESDTRRPPPIRRASGQSSSLANSKYWMAMLYWWNCARWIHFRDWSNDCDYFAPHYHCSINDCLCPKRWSRDRLRSTRGQTLFFRFGNQTQNWKEKLWMEHSWIMSHGAHSVNHRWANSSRLQLIKFT